METMDLFQFHYYYPINERITSHTIILENINYCYPVEYLANGEKNNQVQINCVTGILTEKYKVLKS